MLTIAPFPVATPVCHARWTRPRRPALSPELFEALERLRTAVSEAKAVGSRAVPITFDELDAYARAARAVERTELRVKLLAALADD
jgi:hypothetical protein